MQKTHLPPRQDGRVGKKKRRTRRPRFGPAMLLLGTVLLLAGLTGALYWLGGGDGEGEKTPRETTTPDWVTQAFLPVNNYSRPGTALTQVNGVVVHNTGNPGTTAEQNRLYFEGLADSGETYASSHFIIDIDGEVVQCVPLDEIAYCSNSRNDDTISIEICHPDDTGEFTQESYDALIKLLRWLCDSYGLEADAVMRHGDVIEKNCPRYYMEHEDAWEQLLADVAAA